MYGTGYAIPTPIPTLILDDGRTEVYLPDYKPRVRPLDNPFGSDLSLILDAEAYDVPPAHVIGGRG